MLRPSSRPTASFGPAASLEQNVYDTARAPAAASLSPPAQPRRPRSRTRSIVAKLLFVMLFTAVASLLGFAVKKKLDLASGAPGGAGLFAGVR
jgi:hypothetical protein